MSIIVISIRGLDKECINIAPKYNNWQSVTI